MCRCIGCMYNCTFHIHIWYSCRTMSDDSFFFSSTNTYWLFGWSEFNLIGYRPISISHDYIYYYYYSIHIFFVLIWVQLKTIRLLVVHLLNVLKPCALAGPNDRATIWYFLCKDTDATNFNFNSYLWFGPNFNCFFF